MPYRRNSVESPVRLAQCSRGDLYQFQRDVVIAMEEVWRWGPGNFHGDSIIGHGNSGQCCVFGSGWRCGRFGLYLTSSNVQTGLGVRNRELTTLLKVVIQQLKAVGCHKGGTSW